MEKDDTVITSFPLDEIVKVLLLYLVYVCPSCHYQLYSLSLSLQKAQSANPEEQFGAVQSARYASYFEFVGAGEGQDNTHDVC